MKMHLLPAGRLQMRKNIFYADATRDEKIDIPVFSALLRHRSGNVLFDTGCHPDALSEPAVRWGAMAKVMTPIGQPDQNLITELAHLGLTSSDIDVVVCSHLHTDHCGCNEYFKRATFYCHARELAAANAPDAGSNGYFDLDWKTSPSPITFDAELDLFQDGQIRLVPLPGHTPGLTGALVTLGSGARFLLASDALSVRHSLDTMSAPRNTRDVPEFLQSLDLIRELEKTGVTILCGHDETQWQHLRKGAHAYE